MTRVVLTVYPSRKCLGSILLNLLEDNFNSFKHNDSSLPPVKISESFAFYIAHTHFFFLLFKEKIIKFALLNHPAGILIGGSHLQ